MIQQYCVKDVYKVSAFVELNIGTECHIDKDSNIGTSGEVIVYELMYMEHKAIRKFITDNDLWLDY